MTVSKYASQAGKRYEKLLLDHLREQGYDAERLRLAGSEDEGDLLVRTGPTTRFVIEAKRRKGFDLAGWVKEAQVERDNYDTHRAITHGGTGFVVVHYARGKNISQSYVTTTLEEWLARL